jgi:putative aldouronate transport system substrate-binding protein
MKRFLALLLAGLFLGFGASCNASPPSNAQTPADGTSGGTASPDGAKTVKYTAVIAKGNALTKDVKQMVWLKELQDKHGIEIEWQQYSDDWGQKKSVLFASGSIPDLLFNAAASGDSDVYPGLLEDLTPLIEKHGVNIKKMFTEQPDTLIRATELDGKIYGVCNYNAEQVTTQGSTFINKRWLDALNLKVPTNWDELYDVLVAFRDGDPNGNGDKTDEIPIDFWFLTTYSPINMLGSTGIQVVSISSSEGGYFAEDGVVKNYYVDPRFKDLIKFMHKLYADGLTDPQAFTRDFTAMMTKAAGEGDVAKVGVHFFWDKSSIFGKDIADQYVVLPPLKQSATSTDNVRYSYELFRTFSSLSYAVAMSAKCPDKDRAMQFFDAFYSPEISAQSLYGGITDGMIKLDENGKYTVNQPTDPNFSGTVWMWTNTLGPVGPYYVFDGLLNNAPDTDNAKNEKAVYDEAHARIDFKKDFFGFPYFKISAEDRDTLSLNGANLQTDWVNWVTNGGVDEAWDAHVQTMMNNGLKQNLEIFQKYYDQYIASMK